MSKAFNINLQAKNVPTFEQEDELIAGEAITVISSLKSFETNQ